MHFLAVLLISAVAQDAEVANAEDADEQPAPLVVNVVVPTTPAPPPTRPPGEVLAAANASEEVKEAAVGIQNDTGYKTEDYVGELTREIIFEKLAATTPHPTTPLPTTPQPGIIKDLISAGWSRDFTSPSPTSGPVKRLFVPAHEKTDIAKDVIEVSGERLPDWKMDWRSEQIDADHAVLEVTPLRKEFSDFRRAVKAQSTEDNKKKFYPELQPLVDKLTALDDPKLKQAFTSAPSDPCPIGEWSRCWPKPAAGPPALVEKSTYRRLRGPVSL